MSTSHVVGPLMVAGLLAATACGGTLRPQNVEGGPVSTGAGTLAQARKYLEGQWSLTSFQIMAGGKPTTLPGAGSLKYDAFGNLDIEIRVDDATAQVLEREGIPTTKGVISTNGRTVVDFDSRTLTYVLEGQPLLAAEGGPLSLRRARHWVVDGNVLTLTTRADDGTTLSEARWQKLP